MMLVALRDIVHAVGMIPRGSEFEASDAVGEEMVRGGAARLASMPLPDTAQRNKTFAILASGPSLTGDQIETVRAWRECGENRVVIAVCRTFFEAPWADHMYAADPNWWRHYGERVRSMFRGQAWTHRDNKVGATFGAKQMEVSNKPGLSTTPGIIYSGGNSGYQAIGLAYHLGARRIVLLGFDMQATDGKTHHHGDYPERNLVQNSPFASWVNRFIILSAGLRRAGVVTINATPTTALKCFTQQPLEVALEFGGAPWDR